MPEVKPNRLRSKLAKAVVIIAGVAMLSGGALSIWRGARKIQGGLPSPDEIHGAATAALASMKSFDGGAHGVRLRYPADWRTDPVPGLVFHASTWSGIVNLRLTVEALDAAATLDSYTQAIVMALTQAPAASGRFSKEVEAALVVGGQTGKRLEFAIDLSGAKGQLHARNVVAVFVHGGKG